MPSRQRTAAGTPVDERLDDSGEASDDQPDAVDPAEARIDLLKCSNVDRSTLGVPHWTPLNDCINFFDVHKRKSFFVLNKGAVVVKLYLRDIAQMCDEVAI